MSEESEEPEVYRQTVVLNVVDDHAPLGSTIKVAYEVLEKGFKLGVVFPDGEPWLFDSETESETQLKSHIEHAFAGRAIRYISTASYNRLKAAYRRQRAKERQQRHG